MTPKKPKEEDVIAPITDQVMMLIIVRIRAISSLLVPVRYLTVEPMMERTTAAVRIPLSNRIVHINLFLIFPTDHRKNIEDWSMTKGAPLLMRQSVKYQKLED